MSYLDSIAHAVRLKENVLVPQRWLRALAIAKTLFEDEGYHTAYLEEIEHYLLEGRVEQPKRADEHIRQLYQWARRLDGPMI